MSQLYCALVTIITLQIHLAALVSMGQGSAEPLRARIKYANHGVSVGKADLWPRSVFFFIEPTRNGERARLVGRLSVMLSAWTGACLLARRLHELKASIAMDLGTFSLICV